jgi:hypothetical protein
MKSGRSFDDVVKVIENDKLHYEIPKPRVPEEYRRLMNSDPTYVVIFLRDIADIIQKMVDISWKPSEFLECIDAHLNALGLTDEQCATNPDLLKRNGYQSCRVNLTLKKVFYGREISQYDATALHVKYICHVPVNIVIMVHLNRPVPISVQDIASGADLDMFQTLYNTMDIISRQPTAPPPSPTAPFMIGFVSIFDTALGKVGGSIVRTISTRLNDQRNDMFTLFDGTSDDHRVRRHLELAESEERKEAMTRQAEFEKNERERKQRIYEENLRRDVLRNKVLISHNGQSIQKILLEQEEQWNTYLDGQIQFLRAEVDRIRAEKEAMMKKSQEFARNRSVLPPPPTTGMQPRGPSLPPNPGNGGGGRFPPGPLGIRR